MQRTARTRRSAALLAIVAGVAVVSMTASSAAAQGQTHEHFAAHGWTCFVPPPFPELVSCFSPGQGAPFPGTDRAAYSFRAFDRASGAFLNTGHLIRQDLYNGQPCSGGGPYRFIPRIGYYECVHA